MIRRSAGSVMFLLAALVNVLLSLPLNVRGQDCVMAKDSRPTPIVKLTGGKLSPVSAYDAEELARFANGAEFDLKPRGKRSRPHNHLYWAQLGKIVAATGAYGQPAKRCTCGSKLN
ncbi:MAG: hypothetical protein U5N55_05015 [Cypionkella sp.]|nr:hypothetical protein [Cypionkella sp.]